MNGTAVNSRWKVRPPVALAACALAWTLAGASGVAQTPPQISIQTGTGAVVGTPSAGTSQGETVDRVIAVVNGDLVLESDVDEERRLSAFQPYRMPDRTFSRERAIERLIDRALILQQEKLQQEAPITDAEVNAQLGTLRRDIPACKTYHCDTDAGWQKFIADQGFSLDELRQRWRERMEALRYVEMRFRMGIRVSPEEIKQYYDTTFVPEYAKQTATPPKLADVSPRIQEVLLQERVGKLLDDWLTSLKAQGSVRIMKPGEVAP